MKILFVRRPKLGKVTLRRLSEAMEELGHKTCTSLHEDTGLYDCGEFDAYIRWGTTGKIQCAYKEDRILNKVSCIKASSNKKAARVELFRHKLSLPVWTSVDDVPIDGITSYIIRKANHAGGRFLRKRYTYKGLLKYASKWKDYYISPYIEKTNEYRVFVVNSRVAAISEKIPSDPNAIAWNHRAGSVFKNVRWGSWPLDVAHKAVKANNLFGLDFSAVDLMVDKDGNSYVLELNTGPTLSSSYVISKMAKCLLHSLTEDEVFEIPEDIDSYKDIIHPAALSKEEQ